MINSEKLEKILKKRKDKIPALLEVLRLTATLSNVDIDVFNGNFSVALDKVNELLFLQSQNKRTAGYTLTDSDYKAVGIFENHLEKLRRKSKKSPIKNKLLKLMPKLYKIKQDKHLNYTELQEYFEKKYKIYVSRTYFTKIYKTIN